MSIPQINWPPASDATRGSNPLPAVTGDARELIATTRRLIADGPAGPGDIFGRSRNPTALDVARYAGRLEVLAASLANALEREKASA